MYKITVSKEYFNIYDTLVCGQTFRFAKSGNGFLVYSLDKCAFCYEQAENVVIECEVADYDYFYNYFDIDRDYSKIYNSALNSGYKILKDSANKGKGVRILNQNSQEVLFSFIISQNNNIPRIKSIIEKLCTMLGKKCEFNGVEYYGFPTAKAMAEKPLEFYYSIGLGYRANYIKNLADSIANGFNVESLSSLSTAQLKAHLQKIHGVGPKVCDCVSLFGFHRSDSFPVDTWIEKVYREDFNGKLTDRHKITEWFTTEFKENSGYFQQYLFYYKRETGRK